MCEYVFSIQGSGIKRTDSPRGGSVEGSINYLTCRFEFTGDEWAGTIKTAYFENENTKKKYSQILSQDNTCVVPWEVIADSGMIKVSVAGERDGFRITSGIESFYNGKSICDGEPSEPPTPDQYDKMIAIAQSIRDDADAGEFDGKDGATPQIGENGNWYIGGEDTEKPSRGEKGEPGEKGDPGQNATDEQVSAAVAAYMGDNPIPTAITETASGKHIVVTDSADRPVQDLPMHGWTEQGSTTGKNLFDIQDITPGIVDRTINCYITKNVHVSAQETPTKITTNIWRFRATCEDGSMQYLSDESTFPGVFYATEENPIVKITYRSTYIEEGAYRKIQIEYGETGTEYEPYTGGAPSPSPDYPQEIVSAGEYDEQSGKWKFEIKVTGANLLDYKNITKRGTQADVEYIQNGILINGTLYAEANAIPVSRHTDYHISCSYEVFAGICKISVYKNGYRSGKDAVLFNGSIKEITFNSGEEDSVDILFYASNSSEVEGKVKYTNIMLSEGTKDRPYEPYKCPQSVNLTADRTLTKWDRLERRDGVWGWVYGSTSFSPTGEHVSGIHAEGAIMISENSIGITGDRMEYFSDQFVATSKSISNLQNGESRIAYNNLYLKIDSVSNMEEGKAWLEEKKPTFLIQADDETFAPLSEREQADLNALCTYYPTTIISTDQSCEMKVTYVADTKAYIDKQFAALKEEIIATQAQLL